MNKILPYKSLLACTFIFIMIGASIVFKNKEIILPEMVALAVGCLIYQHPAWLAKPFHIFLLPSITAIGGFLINQMPISLPIKLILILFFVVIILVLFRSGLAPALATGLLPIITNADSVYFIASILTLTFLLFISLHVTNKKAQLQPDARRQSHKEKILYIGSLSLWILICSINGWMFIAAIPPVVIVGYESIHKEQYIFKMFYTQVICLSAAAFIGTVSLYFLSNLLLAALLNMVLVALFLQLLTFKLTPAYATSILPMVLPGTSHRYFDLQVLLMACIVLGLVFFYKNIDAYRYKINRKRSL